MAVIATAVPFEQNFPHKKAPFSLFCTKTSPKHYRMLSFLRMNHAQVTEYTCLQQRSRENHVRLSKIGSMGFRENLKAELAYKDILVKELAVLSGVSRRTIDNYLREDSSMPSVDAAIRIAEALGVTVEYLVTGREQQERNNSPLVPDSRIILKSLESLNTRDRKIVLSLIKSLKEIGDSEKKKQDDVSLKPDRS